MYTCRKFFTKLLNILRLSILKVTIRPGFPRTVLFSGSCPGCHGVLDFVLDLKSSGPLLENVYLSQSQYYVLNVRLLTAMTK